MTYRTFIILYILSQFKGERSISGIFHLVTGKKSAQTVQDGRLFGVTFLFNTMSHLSKEVLLEVIVDLIRMNLVVPIKEEHFLVTEDGNRRLLEFLNLYPFPEYLDGWKYNDISKMFWNRYSLFTQCLSNMLNGNNQFLPITRDRELLLWAKQRFPKTHEAQQLLSNKLYIETERILSKLDDLESSYFVLRLSKVNKVGYTHEQAATFLELDLDRGKIIFQGLLHRFIYEVTCKQEQFTVLHSFIKDLTLAFTLTRSTQITYKLLNVGKSVEEISQIRKLKSNTIEDHVVEIAINVPDFDISPFVNEESQRLIRDTISKLKTKKLKVIKDQLKDDFSYFQIRLIITQLETE
jgi:uncharacterized protein YpbB